MTHIRLYYHIIQKNTNLELVTNQDVFILLLYWKNLSNNMRNYSVPIVAKFSKLWIVWKITIEATHICVLQLMIRKMTVFSWIVIESLIKWEILLCQKMKMMSLTKSRFKLILMSWIRNIHWSHNNIWLQWAKLIQ